MPSPASAHEQTAFLAYFNALLTSSDDTQFISVSGIKRGPLERFEELADGRVLGSALNSIDPKTFTLPPPSHPLKPETWQTTFTLLKRLHHLILSYPILLPPSSPTPSPAVLGTSLSSIARNQPTPKHPPTAPALSPLSKLPTPDLLLISRAFSPSSLSRSTRTGKADQELLNLLTLILLLQSVYGPGNDRVIAKIRGLEVGAQKGLKEVIERGLGVVQGREEEWGGLERKGEEIEEGDMLDGSGEEEDPEASRTYLSARERSRLREENLALKKEKDKLALRLSIKSPPRLPHISSPPQSNPSLSPELDKGEEGERTPVEERRRSTGRKGGSEVERLREELNAKEDELRQTEITLEENIKTLQSATQKIVEMQKKGEKVEDLKEQLEIHKQTAEKLRRAENVNEKLKKKLDETADLRKEMKILEERNTKLATLNSQLQQKAGEGTTGKAVLEAYRSQIGELEKAGKERELETQDLLTQLHSTKQELESLKLHATLLEEEGAAKQPQGALLDVGRIARRQSRMVLSPKIGGESLADEMGAIGEEEEGAVGGTEREREQEEEIGRLRLEIIRLSASVPPSSTTETSTEPQKKLLEMVEKNVALGKQVGLMEEKLLAAKRMLKEQEAVIQNAKTPSFTGTSSAFEEAERSYKNEIDQLKSDLKRAKRTIIEMDKRYRAEKLLMLSAWNDLGQRTMKSDSAQPVSWLAQQRNIISGGGKR